MIVMKNFCVQALVSKFLYQVQLMKNPATVYLERFSMKAKSPMAQYEDCTVLYFLEAQKMH